MGEDGDRGFHPAPAHIEIGKLNSSLHYTSSEEYDMGIATQAVQVGSDRGHILTPRRLN